MGKLEAMTLRAALLVVVAGAGLAQEGSLDPAFAGIPFDQWVTANEQPRIRWSTRILPAELSDAQRLRERVEIQVDGEELAKRRGRGQLLMLVQFQDGQGRVYQTHKTLDLQEVSESAGKVNFIYSQDAFVLPGDYRVSLAVLDRDSGDHSAVQKTLHVNPLKNDPLPAAWRNLPPVELLGETPDETKRLSLPLETKRPVRVELVVNPSNQTEVVPALKVLSQIEIPNGALNVVLLDLARQKMVFEQKVAGDLDWTAVEKAIKAADPKVIDVHSLEKRGHSAQFFARQVANRMEGEPVCVGIVLTAPVAFESGENLHPVELGAKPAGKLYYIRYHAPLPRPEFRPMPEEPRFGRRPLPPALPRATPPREPIDELQRTVKPLDPKVFDVYDPEQFRKALGTILEETSKL